MSTIIKIIITSILSFSLFSCSTDVKSTANGGENVITKERGTNSNTSDINPIENF
ncbi:hypothetical protein [uncultured Gelidibacter sp.]|uniref:hypothetical protein n=1 Tax=uncultured Gelidibacter sp. TaxID=259318 RepID=UPI0026347E66|nr:hypothetical protein [uncultured Gelidibacter sp.]